jgi:uncharacterized protein YbjT (DUF2867 family)
MVTGATGNVGGQLLELLLQGGHDVRALVRDPGKVKLESGVRVPLQGLRSVVAIGDLDLPHSVLPAAQGVKSVFLLGGRRDMPGLVGALREAGVERLVLLSSRSVIGGVVGNAIVDMWNEAERAVQSSGLSWTILRPSGFQSNVLRWRAQLRAGSTVRAPFAAAASAAIDPLDIAGVAAVALLDDALTGQSLELSGPEPLLPEQQCRSLGRALGRELRFEPVVGEEARLELARTFPEPFVAAQLRFFEQGEFDDSPVVPTVQQILMRPPRRFEDWLTAHAAEFRTAENG